jgi:hypothetical protein
MPCQLRIDPWLVGVEPGEVLCYERIPLAALTGFHADDDDHGVDSTCEYMLARPLDSQA